MGLYYDALAALSIALAQLLLVEALVPLSTFGLLSLTLPRRGVSPTYFDRQN
jgi:hypothetical protein